MSGSKDTDVNVAGDGAALVGGAVLVALAIPVAVGVLGYYAGKVVVKGTVGAGHMAADGVRQYQEYQHQKELERQYQMAERLARTTADVVNQVKALRSDLAAMKTNPLFRDVPFDTIESEIEEFLKQSRHKTLDQVIADRLHFNDSATYYRTLVAASADIPAQKSEILRQMAVVEQTARNQGDSNVLAEVERFRRLIANVTASSFSGLKQQWSSFQLTALQKMRFASAYTQACTTLDAIWQSMAVSRKEAQNLAPAEYAELDKIDRFVRSQKSAALASVFQTEVESFQRTFTRMIQRINQVQIQQQEQEKLSQTQRAVFKPQLAELTNLLELAHTPQVKHWSAGELAFLRAALDNLNQSYDEGRFQNFDENIAGWKERFETMITEAGIKQKQADRRQYIIEALKKTLPTMGFDIQSIAGDDITTTADTNSSASMGSTTNTGIINSMRGVGNAGGIGSMNDVGSIDNMGGPNSATVIKVSPKVSIGSGKKRITIAVPNNPEEPVNYRFDGFSVKKTRQQGRPVVENDDGKETVAQIAVALRPFGICISAPDWSGNPDRIRKGAKDLPNTTGPAAEEELEFQQEEQKYRHMNWEDQ